MSETESGEITTNTKPMPKVSVSKTMGLAVVFIAFAVYQFGSVWVKITESADIEHPAQTIFIYAIIGLGSSVFALILASISLHRHQETPNAVNWWLVFASFVLCLALFAIILFKYLEEINTALL